MPPLAKGKGVHREVEFDQTVHRWKATISLGPIEGSNVTKVICSETNTSIII